MPIVWKRISLLLVMGWAFACIQPMQASATENSLIIRGFIGASPKSLHNAGPPLHGEMGSGPLIGGGIGFTLGERWQIGVMGESIARQGSELGDPFTVSALSLWAKRRVLVAKPLSVGAEFDLGVALVHRNRAHTLEGTVWEEEFSQYGLLIQPGVTFDWSPVKPLEIFGMIAYRWASNGTLQGFGSDLIIDGKTVEVDLNGPVVLAGITVFLPWSEL